MADFVQRGRAVPVIEKERLRLRGHRPEDFADCAAMWADPVVTRYVGGKPLSEEEAWARTLRCVGHWAWLGFGYWVVEEKATGNFAGEMGFSDWKREIDPSLKGVPELGWILATRVHGKGLRQKQFALRLRGAMPIFAQRNRRWGRWCALFTRSMRGRFASPRSADSTESKRRRTKGNRRSCSPARTSGRPKSKREILGDAVGVYPAAPLMASRAFRRASFASALALLSGFSRSMAL